MEIRRIPENTSDYARWLAGEITKRAGGIRLSPTTSLFVGMALEGYAQLLDRGEASALPFVVTAMEPSGESEVVAAALNLHIAAAAYTAAVMARPGARIMLRHGARVISDNEAPPGAAVPRYR